MISAKTAARIWEAYREISASEKILSDMQAIREKEWLDEHQPTLRDAFGRQRDLQLGIPSGEVGHKLFNVSPILAESVIKAHIEFKKAELVEA